MTKPLFDTWGAAGCPMCEMRKWVYFERVSSLLAPLCNFSFPPTPHPQQLWVQPYIDTHNTCAHTLRIPEIHIMQNHKPVHPIVNKLKQMIHACPHCVCRHIIMLNTLMYATMYTPAAHCLPLFCAFLLHYVTKSLVLRTWKRLHLPLSSGEARSTRGRLFWSRVLATEWNAELLEASYFTMCLLEICWS